MDDELLKLECLKLCNGDIAEAEKRFNWLKGRSLDYKPPASLVAQATVPKADVVGRDGEFKKPFSDYLKRDE